MALFDYAIQKAFQIEGHERRWVHIAARDATITLWDFGDALKHIEETVRLCAPLAATKRVTALRAIKGRFGNAFPDAKRMRRISAHPVGHMATARERKRNAYRGSLGHCNIYGRKITHTHEGRLVSFQLTEDSIRKLEEIRDAVFKEFQT